MKLVHYNTFLRGGAAIAALRQHNALLTAGAQSDFLCLYSEPELLDTYPRIHDFRADLSLFNRLKLKVKNKSLEMKNAGLLTSGGEIQELYSFTRSVWDVTDSPYYSECDIAHFHWVSRFLDVNTLNQRNTKKLVFTLHDFFPFTGGFHYPGAATADFLKEITARQRSEWENFIAKHKPVFITPSAYLKNSILKMGWSSLESSIHVLRYAIDDSRYVIMDREEAKDKVGLSPNEKHLLFIADHLDYNRKGFDIVAQRLSEIARSAKLIVIGKHPGKFEPILKDKNIVYVGAVHSEQTMNLYYNAANAVLQTAREDNYPNTILESLATGTPVIAMGQGGANEVIKQGVNGFLSSPQDLVKHVEEACQTAWNRQQIRTDILQNHSFAEVGARHLELYRKI